MSITHPSRLGARGVMFLLRAGLAGVKSRLFDSRGFVVGAGLAVLIGFGLEVVFALCVLAGELAGGGLELAGGEESSACAAIAAGEGGSEGAGEHGCGDQFSGCWSVGRDWA